MSVISSQPSPFEPLRREKHIESFSRVPKPGRKVCRCMENLEIHQTPQQEPQVGSSPRNKEKKGQLRNKMVCNHKGVRVVKTGCNQVTSVAPRPAPAPHKRPREGEIQRTLTVVEELDELAVPGLEVLAGAQQLSITAKTKPQGLSCDPERLYVISSHTAKQLLVGIEDSSCLCLHLCGPARSCILRLCDQSRQEVMRIYRPYRMDVCCLCCCLMVITVFSAASNLIGSVQQRWSMFSPSLAVCNPEGKTIMEIRGSWSATRCHSDQEFEVTSLDGKLLAVIWKRWPGFNEEYNMDHDFFGLDISALISSSEKALLLAATFLLNYMFFEMS